MKRFRLGAIIFMAAAILAAAGGLLWAAEDIAGKSKDEAGTAWEPFSPPVGQNQLFVDLKKMNDRYVIARVSNQPLMFRLNDFKPQFDIRSYYCTQSEGQYLPQVYRPEMCKDDEKRFRRVKVDVLSTMKTDFVTFVVNLFRGNVEKYSVFDVEEYRSAIEEALQNSGLDREKTLNSYDRFLAGIEEMRVKRASGYALNLKEAASVQFRLNIDDRSGLYKNDLAARDLVSIKPKDIPIFDPKTIAFSGVDSVSIEASLRKAGETYAAALEEATSYYQLEKLSVAHHYSLHVDAPDKIFFKDGDKQTVPLQVTIFSKNLVNLSPHYLNENDDLRLEDDGRYLVFSNKSQLFVRIDALIAHYGRNVMSAPLNIDLAPGAFMSLDRSDSRLHLPPRENYNSATKDSIKGQTLSFGYDVRYRVLGHQASRSLQKIEEHQVYDLVK